MFANITRERNDGRTSHLFEGAELLLGKPEGDDEGSKEGLLEGMALGRLL